MTYRYLLFNKPYGVLSQFTDSNSDRPTLKDYINVPSVYAVGRLDQDSEGLLLLTNNGAVQHQLSDPKFDHPKTYWVQVEGIPTPEAIAQLQQGVAIQTYKTRPAQVKFLPESLNIPPRQPPIRFRAAIPTIWLEITLTEGKNRQVRRMTAAVGFPTLRLIRVAIAQLTINSPEVGELEVGQWRDLTPLELKSILGSVHKPIQPNQARRKNTHNY
ncbi:pseudouridine synthase family protein [Synechococcus sp. PCC 7502]|uniref:pseudouridine synthase n=1 Tax=Synechococcus sp. PCC 7502 TaxID=1173263 RepID=UPI00029F9430|nr:pseudouridine synthase [Synechococcus sp. PCC 7502]AFY72230.1 pseudouridine synthase family protein [Synechococcus sp. PCC 7502]